MDDEIDGGSEIVQQVAIDMGATIERIQTAPDFRRMLVSRGGETVVVDLVREYVFQVDEDKRTINGIRVDSPEEILANKLTALLSRSEIRDLTDIYHLENAGYELEPAVRNAEQKDTGFSPAQLAWVLNGIALRDDASLPGNIPVPVLRRYLAGLIQRLQRLAMPRSA
ncbi:MAG TPA: nucleotidyl transferase AbiEii/AbiGii toxin family protein [Pyrinomonadaceae bacterium]|nr:nucleotidyl transferase AbiEii/AbiGii toxin family protein [Pyrinomonadaceae bacterium]